MAPVLAASLEPSGRPPTAMPAQRLALRCVLRPQPVYVIGRNAGMAGADAAVTRRSLVCSQDDRMTGRQLGDRSRTHGQPAALASGRGPGSSWMPRCGLFVQGRPDRLPASGRLLRCVGSRPRRDGEPCSRAGGRLADPDLPLLGRLTQSQTTVTDPADDHSASEQLKNNRRTTEDATPETTGPLLGAVVAWRGRRRPARPRRPSAGCRTSGIVIRRASAAASGDGRARPPEATI